MMLMDLKRQAEAFHASSGEIANTSSVRQSAFTCALCP